MSYQKAMIIPIHHPGMWLSCRNACASAANVLETRLPKDTGNRWITCVEERLLMVDSGKIDAHLGLD